MKPDSVKNQMSVLQKLMAFEQTGRPDSIIQVFTWYSLFASAVLKSKNPTSKYGKGFHQLFVKLDGFRWVLRFLGIIPTLEALVAKRHLEQPTALLRNIHLVKNILYFLYHPLERLSWLKNNAPDLVEDLDYDKDWVGRTAVKCWLANMLIDYFLMWKSYQSFKKGSAEMTGLMWQFFITSLWVPMAYTWSVEKSPILNTEIQVGALCSVASTIGLGLEYSAM